MLQEHQFETADALLLFGKKEEVFALVMYSSAAFAFIHSTKWKNLAYDNVKP